MKKTLLLLATAFLSLSAKSYAGISFCNQANYPLILSVGLQVENEGKDDISTIGWKILRAGTCKEIFAGRPSTWYKHKHMYLFGYARNEIGRKVYWQAGENRRVYPGIEACISSKKVYQFTHGYTSQSCGEKGFKVPFALVDLRTKFATRSDKLMELTTINLYPEKDPYADGHVENPNPNRKIYNVFAVDPTDPNPHQ